MNLSVNSGLKQGYTLDVIGYDQWPSVTIKYAFKNIGPIPQLQLNYKFDTAAYLPQKNSADTDLEALKQKATADLVTFKNIHNQLSWLYSTDEKPDEQLRVIKHAATTNLTPAAPLSFAGDDHVSLSKFVKTITTWLQRLLDDASKVKHAARTPVMKPVLLPITGALAVNNIFEIGVNLHINRIDADTSLQVSQTSKTILPDIKTGVSLKAGQKAFAQSFETAFKTTGSQLKLASGRGDYNNATQLWAVRWADSDKSDGIYYDITPDIATSFAPVLLLKNLINGDVSVPAYVSGQGIDPNALPVNIQYRQVDLDAWMATFLQSVDLVLAPSTINAVVTCATLNTLQQPGGVNPLQEILATKTGIAAQLVKLLALVVTEQTGNLDSAAQHLTNQLNYELANFYSGTAIVQFNASVTANSGSELVNLYGKIVPVSATRSASFSEALIPNATGSTISFTVKPTNARLQSYLPISVTYQPTGLDYKFDEGVVIPLSFIIPPVGNSTVLSANVPLVLRAYPQALTIADQANEKTYADDAINIQNVKLYNYTYRYNQPTVAQQIVETRLVINGISTLAASSYGDSNNLFESLAQFISVYPQIVTDLKTSLPLINNETTVDSKAYKVALPALITLAGLIKKVKSALNATNTTLKAEHLSQNPTAYYSFTLKQGPVKPVTDKRLLIQVTANKGQSAQLGLPLLLIDGYDAVLFDTVENDASITKSYTYVSAANEPLLFNSQLTQLSPVIKVTSLDILSAEKITLLVNETRNKNLLPNPKGGHYTTDERFIYTIPQNSSIPTFTPGLFWDGVELDLQNIKPTPAKANLQVCLQLLFGKLFSNINDVTYNTRVKVSYEYKIDDSGILPPVSIPVLLTPMISVNTSDKSTVASDLYNSIKNWLDAVSPEGNEPRLYFEMDIFTSLKESDTPLLTIDRLYFNLSDVN
nr:hypothetical protein [Mucilaginibacter sp. L294]